MTVSYIVRKHWLPGWEMRFGVFPVIAGWPQPKPVAVFYGPGAAQRHCCRLNHSEDGGAGNE